MERQKAKNQFKKSFLPRNRGGLGIPDVYVYYLSYNGVYPLSWAYKKRLADGGTWRWLEQKIISENCKDFSLTSLWYHPKNDKRIKNPIILFSCKIARTLHKQLQINGLSLPSCPIWQNPLFMAGGKPISNDTWQNKSISELGQILNNN